MASTTGLPELVWYASYGSNLNRARFMAYIEGGTVAGNDVVYGCTDTTAPRDDISWNYRSRCTLPAGVIVPGVGPRPGSSLLGPENRPLWRGHT